MSSLVCAELIVLSPTLVPLAPGPLLSFDDRSMAIRSRAATEGGSMTAQPINPVSVRRRSWLVPPHSSLFAMPMRIAAVCAILLSAGGCWTSDLFGSKESVATPSVSVFKVEIGQCFTPPTGSPKKELADLTALPCTAPHTQEAYAELVYKARAGGDDSIYPGNDALTSFADGSCAQAFQGYVGVSYLDSSLFFTYLLPSARGWEQQSDRTVLCFVTTTGQPLVVSVKGSKR